MLCFNAIFVFTVFYEFWGGEQFRCPFLDVTLFGELGQCNNGPQQRYSFHVFNNAVPRARRRVSKIALCNLRVFEVLFLQGLAATCIRYAKNC